MLTPLNLEGFVGFDGLMRPLNLEDLVLLVIEDLVCLRLFPYSLSAYPDNISLCASAPYQLSHKSP